MGVEVRKPEKRHGKKAGALGDRLSQRVFELGVREPVELRPLLGQAGFLEFPSVGPVAETVHRGELVALFEQIKRIFQRALGAFEAAKQQRLGEDRLLFLGR